MAPRGQLTEQAYEIVKERLRTGVYRAGDRISVEDIVIELGTSRQPVMDALKRLAIQRFIEIIPQVGVRVLTTERQEMVDFFRLLGAMETVIAELAAQRADKKGAEKLAEVNETVAQLLLEDIDDEQRVKRYRALNRDFHRQLTAIAGSHVLASISAYMWDQSDFFISSAFDPANLKDRLRAAYEEHILICQAVAANDPAGARKAMNDHVDAFTQNFEHIRATH